MDNNTPTAPDDSYIDHTETLKQLELEKEKEKKFISVSKTLTNGKVMVDKRKDGIYIRLAGNESEGEYFTLDWVKILDFNTTSNTKNFAQRELDILSKSSTDPDNRPIIEEFIPELLALVDKFGHSGQSGGSAPYTASALSQAVKHLCLQEPICPITGIDDEWMDVRQYGDGDKETEYQNNRCYALFKNSEGRCWYLDAIVWSGEDEWDAFTGTVEGVNNRQFIKEFPFIPKTFYVDVVKESLPDDWTAEPFYENDKWYDIREFEETGIKNWKPGGKYRYKIKDISQLEEVYNYYDDGKDLPF